MKARTKWIIGCFCILVVTAIIIVSPYIANAYRMANQAYARSRVQFVYAALKAYQIEYGALPTGRSPAILRILQGDNPRKLVFFEAPKKDFDSVGRFVDPWGSPVQIDVSDPKNPKVWSIGKNKKDEHDDPNSDDICSWR